MAPRAVVALAAGCLALTAGVAPGGEGIDAGTRLEGLEVRLEALTRRVQALETVLKEMGPGSSPTAAQEGEPVWEFDAYVEDTPFNVLQRSFDRKTGRVDLLLDVVAQLPDADRWASKARGAPVPLTLTADRGDGGTGRTQPLRLERASQIMPGARLHVSAALDPADAKLVRRLRIVHESQGPSAEVEAQ